MASKTVNLEVEVVKTPDPEDEDYYYYGDDIEKEQLEEMRRRDEEESGDWDVKVEDIKASLHRIRGSVNALSRYQDGMIASYTQDMNMAEKNNENIAVWSLAHLAVLLGIGAVQVLMIKSLFADRTFGYRLVSGMADLERSSTTFNKSY